MGKVKSRKHIAHLWYAEHKKGYSYTEIADKYDVTKSTVIGAVWRHVKKDGYAEERKRRLFDGY